MLAEQEACPENRDLSAVTARHREAMGDMEQYEDFVKIDSHSSFHRK